ncbi:PAS domain-containing sensor histidine kinase [Herminiimonas fonticola]|uniref:PAS/PAC sensor signal transduction histidine kinase n=1 Tax=Herminiimonas fonticola TaxID=303380 RepID=A0A4V3BUY8_9BURK|nr:PAS domain S-box protein [Herminiimonas fonticola]RBA23331.1 PAS domain S-box protein [Herminiimonas fonticola]TDN89048.1 PAS/PAC sensor signal transduction histidine kinase [Herminiimonas fonticola]
MKTRLPAEAERALWRDKLMLLMESTSDGVYGIDLAGLCTFINPAGAAMLGYSVDQMLGQNMHCLMHHSHEHGHAYPEEDCPIYRAFRAGRTCKIDKEVFWRADGSSFAVEYSSHQIVEQGKICGAVVLFSDISERRQAERQLHRTNRELELRVIERTAELSGALAQMRELSAYADSALEEERRRIAREIHDELGSLLVALKLDVSWMEKRVVDRAEVAGKCRAMNRLIESAVENVGRMITDLRPSILDHQGLIAALEWQLQEFIETTEMECDSSIEVADDIHAPDGNLATAIFRIFQEMLSNVARHAQASAIQIRIQLNENSLVMAVHDNGIGAQPFDLDSSRSYGVMGMRERAMHFGGSLEIISAPGKGTLARLFIPLAPQKCEIVGSTKNPHGVSA